MMKPQVILPALTVLLASSVAVAAPTPIEFWYSLAGSKAILQTQIDAFNASQKDYQIVPKLVGNYREAETRLIAALRAGNGPVIFQAENAFFTKLVTDGALENLERFEKTLEPDFVKDFYAGVWNYGDYDGKRYGLPWNTSTPVLYYNATAFAAKGLKPPKTYAELESVSKALTNRASKGYIVVADSWQFEQMVLARGGNVVTADGKPNFDSPEVVAALEMLARMSKNGTAVPRSLGEAPFAILDFARTKAFMAMASIANATDIEPYSVAFKLGIAPMPCDKKCAVPIGGAQMVVLKGATPQEQSGTFAFWKFLMEPKNLEAWVQSTYYVSPRKSILPLLKDFYRDDPQRKTAFEQLEIGVPRPRVPGYALWRGYLEEAIEKATKNGVPVLTALAEAQRKALVAK